MDWITSPSRKGEEMKLSTQIRKIHAAALLIALIATPFAAMAQASHLQAPENKYTVAQDVQLGRQAANEVRQKMPLLPENGDVDNYVERVGQRLVAAIPTEYRHPQFRYQFNVVNARDINAFSLPGGPLFVNRGMIEAARNEGELAGVLAHEISHTALRHGTAQATKAQSWEFQLPAIGGAILGAIIGGNAGGLIAQGTQFGLSAYFLKFSRDYERQADLLGAQIMARAGYDPRDLANVFQTIERVSGSGGPEWLSSHPNPGNRYEDIMQEARALNVNPSRARQNTAAFNRIQAELRRMPRAQTLEEISRNGGRYSQAARRRYSDGGQLDSRRIAQPSARYRTYSRRNQFQLNVPENWREFADGNSVTFAPAGAYGTHQGQEVFTHGVMAGMINARSRNLQTAADRYVNALLQNNPYLNAPSGYRRTSIDGRNALQLTLSGRSPITGRDEVVEVYTTMLRNGELFYLIGVTPRDQSREYDQAFREVLQSVNLRI